MKKLTTWLLILILLVNLIPVFIPIVKASPSAWFVSTTGNDTSGDGSIENPYASIRKAMDMSSNGDIIYIRGGHYKKANIDPAEPNLGLVIDKIGISKNQPGKIKLCS